jgi:acylphosphatase
MGSPRRVIVVVSGRVQGVFFRASCAQEASARGLGGWVRNRFDGSVEAAFEGDEDAVDRMISWCREGPRGAIVSDIDVRDETPIGEHGFHVTG